MRRLGDRLVGRGAVVLDPAPVEALVARKLVMDLRAARERRRHVDDGVVLLEFRGRLDRLDGVERLLGGLGDHCGVGVADMAHLAMGEHGPLGLVHRRSVAAVDEPACGVAAHFGEVLAGVDGEHAGHRLGRVGAGALDRAMRDLRAGEGGVAHARRGVVVGVLSASCQEADVLAPLCRGAESSVWHFSVLPDPVGATRRRDSARLPP